MRLIRVHILKERYTQKPKREEIGKISKRITENIQEMDIQTFAREVGEMGRAFTPAIFNGNRKIENFVSQEIVALDFDEGITVDEFFKKAEKYQILPAVIYATYSYTEEYNRFRAVFINECTATNVKAAAALTGLLMTLFPECDTHCKDVSRLFLGGKKLIYFNENAEINLKDVAVSVQAQIMENDSKNYSRKIKQIGKELDIEVEHNLLCIHKMTEIAESEESVTEPYIIMGNVLNSSKSCVFHTHTYPASRCEKIEYDEIRNKSEDYIAKSCLLFKELYVRELLHKEKFLLATNLIHVRGGKKLFFSGKIENVKKWEVEWKYIKEYNYHPQSCRNGGCPYVEQCRCRTLYEKLKEK